MTLERFISIADESGHKVKNYFHSFHGILARGGGGGGEHLLALIFFGSVSKPGCKRKVNSFVRPWFNETRMWISCQKLCLTCCFLTDHHSGFAENTIKTAPILLNGKRNVWKPQGWNLSRVEVSPCWKPCSLQQKPKHNSWAAADQHFTQVGW